MTTGTLEFEIDSYVRSIREAGGTAHYSSVGTDGHERVGWNADQARGAAGQARGVPDGTHDHLANSQVDGPGSSGPDRGPEYGHRRSNSGGSSPRSALNEYAIFFVAAMLLTAAISGMVVYKAIDYGHRYEQRGTLPE